MTASSRSGGSLASSDARLQVRVCRIFVPISDQCEPGCRDVDRMRCVRGCSEAPYRDRAEIPRRS